MFRKSSQTSIADFLKDRQATVILLCFTAVALFLRLRNLGELGFRWDEDITALAVKGIVEHGYPVFPTGLIYIRSVAFDYLLALSTLLFGFNEWALRLPSAFLGAATIPLAYLFARKLFDEKIGLIVAGVMAVSFWELEMSRYARMYAGFSFFYLFTVLAFHRYYIEKPRCWAFVAVLLACFTVTLHTIGFTLALMFLIPLLFEDRQGVSQRHWVAMFGLVAAFSVLWFQLIGYFFYIPATEQVVTGGATQPIEAGALWQMLETSKSKIGRLHMPSVTLLKDLYQNAFPAFAVFTLVCGAVALYFVTSAVKQRRVEDIILVFVTLFAYLHQFALVGLFIFLYIFFRREGLFGLQHPQVVRVFAVSATVFAAWLLYGLLAGNPSVGAGQGKITQLFRTLKALSDYPQFIVWLFFGKRPEISLIAAIGFLWCFHGAAKKTQDRNMLFLILVFGLSIVPLGLFGARPRFRYFVHLDVFYFTFFALGLAKWNEVVAMVWPKNGLWGEWGPGLLRNPRLRTAIAAVIVMTVAVGDLNPLRSWLSTDRGYYESGVLFKRFRLDHYPDHKTTAKYVKDRLRDEDVVIVMDWMQQSYYVGNVDYWIRTGQFERTTYRDNGTLRDIYNGVPVIRSLHELKSVLNANATRRRWIITSSEGMSKLTKVSAGIVQFLENSSGEQVYLGRDQRSKVYLFDGNRSV